MAFEGVEEPKAQGLLPNNKEDRIVATLQDHKAAIMLRDVDGNPTIIF